MKTSHLTRAFSLIELIVVIAIISLLTGIIITNLSTSKGKSRDVARVSDISQIQLALELYFDRCHKYPQLPGGATVGTASQLLSLTCTDQQGQTVTFSDYISKIPTPPGGTTQADYDIAFNHNSMANPPTDYVLHAALEASNSTQQNSLDEGAFSTFVFNNAIVPSPSWHCYESLDYPNEYCVGPK